ncbi:MAG: hypothetical protein ACJ79H_22535 [Myxococcales bacterium]
MTAKTCIPALAALLSLPALAQGTTVQQQPGSTTTVQSTPGSTTVQTQPPPPPPQPAPGTQVVVNPPPNEAAPPPPATSTRVSAYDSPVVVEEHRRDPVAIVATDALYGGIAGVLVGGGIALLDNGDHWQRDLMIGAGAGILAGVGVGIAQVVIAGNESPRTRAVADSVRREGARAPGGTALALSARW